MKQERQNPTLVLVGFMIAQSHSHARTTRPYGLTILSSCSSSLLPLDCLAPLFHGNQFVSVTAKSTVTFEQKPDILAWKQLKEGLFQHHPC